MDIVEEEEEKEEEGKGGGERGGGGGKTHILFRNFAIWEERPQCGIRLNFEYGLGN